ncbi:hypothetical protein [Paenibacillus sp. GM2]|uniref:hypothetical protein n=1 Tax=Paenibacillus sp. GM2 TaxID=1622070 RepID=UPI000837ED37|nr:hypothetical protein [Paenibacillus sp. GM2]
MSIQFIIDGIGFDFWPISWERAERMASFQEDKTTIIADSKLLYVRSEEDRGRFMKLRETISTMQGAEKAQEMVEKAEAELRNVYLHLYRMSRAVDTEDITFYRIGAHEVLTKVFQSLALLNRTYYTRGIGKNMEQVLGLPLKPARLKQHIDAVMCSSVNTAILQACEELTASTLDLVLAQKEKYYETPSYPDRMKGFYEELKGVMDKIITACETDDYDTAFFSAIHVQDTIAGFLFFAETGHWPTELSLDSPYIETYRKRGFPELIATLDSQNLSKLQAAVESLVVSLDRYLRGRGVEIHCFENVQQFTAFLERKP